MGDGVSKVYYKAVRPDGTDFRTGTIDYAAALGGKVTAPSAPRKDGYECCTDGVLHASVMPTETLIGGSWPCRLFEVTGRAVASEGHKRGFRSLNIVREIPAHHALGPQGAYVAELIERASSLTYSEARSWDAASHAARGAALGAAWGAALGAARGAALGAAWDAALDAARGAALGAAWDAARGAALGAAWDAALDAARDAARGAALGAALGAGALLVRDLIGTALTQDQYDILSGPWRRAIGPLHPEDAPL